MGEVQPPTPPLALVGPTGVGKTEVAVSLAASLDAEIVCVDSTTVYRGMDIGTAKPTPAQRAAVPHHLLDVVDAGERLSVSTFQSLAGSAAAGIRDRGHAVLLVGGSGLYYRALVDGLRFPGTDPALRVLLEAEATVVGSGGLHARLREFDPVAADRIDPHNARRVVRALEVAALTGRPFSSFATAWTRYSEGSVRAAGLTLPRTVLHRRIEQRAELTWGAVLAETARLLDRGAGGFLNSVQAIGYAEGMQVLAGRLSSEDGLASTIRRTKALARRQMGWFRRDPRIRWFDAEEGAPEELAGTVAGYLGQEPALLGEG
jgi:tRNA dimethylallyltransferase